MKNIIYLDGLWEFRLDPEKEGIKNKYYTEDFESRTDSENIILPAAFVNEKNKSVFNYTNKLQKCTFSGYVWFQRKVVLKSIDSKNVKLFLERAPKSEVWINGIQLEGISDSPDTPHIYNINDCLKVGENTITVLTDNTATPSYCSAIIGEISLRSYENCYAENIQVFPDIESKSVKIKFRLIGTEKILLKVSTFCGSDHCREQRFAVTSDCNGMAEFTYLMSDNLYLWSEYTPYCYTMKIALSNGDTETVTFGMREFSVSETGFKINGTPLFLRGIICSDITASDSKNWLDMLKYVKKFGINYCRFDDFCPPDAAFAAADMLGLYLEPDCHDSSRLIEISHFFGNHPSFFMPADMNAPKPTATNVKSISTLPIYPCFDEDSPYKTLDPENYKRLKSELKQKGFFERSRKFFKSSVHFCAEHCKKEIETAMLTQNLDGFQISGIRDFYAGITKNKQLSRPEKWLGFCSDKTLLAKFNSYVVTGNEFTAEIYSRCCTPEGFADDYIRWEMSTENHIIDGGEITVPEKSCGLLKIGVIKLKTDVFAEPCKITLTLAAKETENSYDFWVFPKLELPESFSGLLMTDNLSEALAGLKNGSPVLLITDKLKNFVRFTDNCRSNTASPDSFEKTAGLHINNKHRALSMFPCESYLTQQWQELMSDSVCAVLDDTTSTFTPIVEPIDNWKRCHRLGILFEAKVSYGRLMVCTIPRKKLTETLSGKWLLKSIGSYCGSELFKPSFRLDEQRIKSIFE